jgi:hypothetical protein
MHITCGDAEVRSALRSYVRAKHAAEPDTVVVEELGLCRGRVRIDLAVVNGLLHGFEIKSDKDCLRRLPTQAGLYSGVFDRLTLVSGDRHLTEAIGMVPSWWGVLRYDPGADPLRFRIVRRGRRNPQRDPRLLVELLWLDEALSLLNARGAVRGVRGKPRSVVWDKICKHFDVNEIAATVRASLKVRAATQAPA